MDNFIEMDFDEFCDTYKPIINHIDTNASFDNGYGGIMFETYGDEVEFVRDHVFLHPNTVWTYCDGDDGGTYICDGMHMVNRIGYFVTTVPYDDKQYYQIQIIEGKDE